MKRRQMTPETAQKVLAEYHQGVPKSVLSERHNTSRQSINRLIAGQTFAEKKPKNVGKLMASWGR